MTQTYTLTQVLAAKLRVSVDERLGYETPERIRRMAAARRMRTRRDGRETFTHRQVLAAQLRLRVDEKLGYPTPESVKRVAAATRIPKTHPGDDGEAGRPARP